MTETQRHPDTNPKVVSTLAEIGIKEYSPPQLEELFGNLQETIHIGIHREGPPTMSDGGLLAIPSGVDPISPDEWKQVPSGRKVISCAIGGSNWVSSVVEKTEDQSIKESAVHKVHIPVEQRDLTYSDFIHLISQPIFASAQSEGDSINTVAISFGFGHSNVNTEQGIDASLQRDYAAKSWNIRPDQRSKDDRSLVGHSLLQVLHRKNLPVDHIFILNDTNAVCNDIAIKNSDQSNDVHTGVGFVFGTGVNAALGQYNLEIGAARIIQPDEVLLGMVDHNLISSSKETIQSQNYLEQWIGGDTIQNRIAVALMLNDEHEIARRLFLKPDPELMNGLAARSMTMADVIARLNMDISPHTFDVMKTVADKTLTQTGQLIGTTIAAVLAATGKHNSLFRIPVEGSVFWKGYSVKETALQTASALLNNTQIVAKQASSMHGMAQLAMARTSS